jgi:hypothetical protein
MWMWKLYIRILLLLLLFHTIFYSSFFSTLWLNDAHAFLLIYCLAGCNFFFLFFFTNMQQYFRLSSCLANCNNCRFFSNILFPKLYIGYNFHCFPQYIYRLKLTKRCYCYITIITINFVIICAAATAATPYYIYTVAF